MITAERLREVLRYNSNTGDFWWRVQTNNRMDMSKPAGCLNGSGYRVIRIDKHLYRAHRLAWLYIHGVWPAEQVDHINADRSDNRMENLREATNTENCRNKSKQSNNTTGFKGVSFYKLTNKWESRIKVNGKNIRLGYYDCPYEAHAAYCKASVEYYGEFARAD